MGAWAKNYVSAHATDGYLVAIESTIDKGDIAHEMVAFLKEHGTPFERDDAALTVLERWGTMSFEEVAGRAIEYARDGFVLRPRTARAIERELDFINEWPGNQSYWLKPDGSLYKAGETIAFPKTARTLSRGPG